MQVWAEEGYEPTRLLNSYIGCRAEDRCKESEDELEKCDANHYIILFRDAGCQFRALYCYYPDTEEIYKLTGTGPKSITKKMIDKLYKYSSDRKQFNLIPAKTMSVSVDALTIHNHLWQPKRPAAPKKTQTRK
ncbi:hypothetical protein HPG69_007391 [Diceros bicornis minor]|uniref:CKK domain-containing protein n=1 Tax=Diceros bicornis minor TaxID=77932 RepID=A0A7J7E393_DICBM|nr:hypothetical protein HPG69_007391 [Diceros bicornis minor]